jgi:hypothetical protein
MSSVHRVRNRIEATRMKRMATGESARSEPGAPKSPMSSDCLQRILRAGRCEPTARRKQGRQQQLVAADQTAGDLPGNEQQPRHWSIAVENGIPGCQELGSELVEARLVGFAPGSNHQIPGGLLRLNVPPPNLPEPPAQTIAGHRGRLELGDDQPHPWLARWIVDPDHVQVLEATAPAKVEAAADVGRAREPMGPRQARRWRQEPPCFEGKETVRRLRPFLRLRDNTARPQRVAIRARNPCLLIRRLFRGRYDGFIRVVLQNEPWKLLGRVRLGQGDEEEDGEDGQDGEDGEDGEDGARMPAENRSGKR